MADSGGTVKVCVACGEDCSARPRIKDVKGRYYCKPCHEQASDRLRETAAMKSDAKMNLIDIDASDALVLAPSPGPEAAQNVPTTRGARWRSASAARSAGSPRWIAPLVAAIAIIMTLGAGGFIVWRLAFPGIDGPVAEFGNSRFGFKRPQNWTVSEYQERPHAYSRPGDSGPPARTADEADVTIEASGGASMRIVWEASRGKTAVLLEGMAEDVQVSLSNPFVGEGFTAWGSFSGDGKTLDGDGASGHVACRVFVTRLDADHVLRVIETCPDSQRRRTRAGFELIRSSLVVR